MPPQSPDVLLISNDENPKRHDAASASVVFVLAGLSGGGAERVISLISGSWQHAGRQVTIIAFDSADEPSFHSIAPGTILRRLAVPASRKGRLAAIRSTVLRIVALRRALNTTDADVIISFLTKINVLTLLACLFSNRLVVISERNNPQLQEKSKIWNVMLATLSWRANAIVMPTLASLASLGPWSRRRAIVIGNPISIGSQAARDRHPYVLAAAGRLTPQKGFDLLIPAFARVAGKHPDWQLVIWGEGELRNVLQRQIDAAGMSARITLPGNSRNPEEWVSGATAFVMSSRYEGFCNALGEAMAGGLPVAAFACDYGAPEMIDDEVDGLLVPLEDVDALAVAIDRLMADAALRDRLGRAAKASMRRFDPSVIIARWDQLVLDLLCPSRTPVAADGLVSTGPCDPSGGHQEIGPYWSTGSR